jgi:hypothetical protein
MEEFNDHKVTQYLIPANVTTKFEFFEGFGWRELRIVAMAAAVGVFLFFLLSIPQKTVLVDASTNMAIEENADIDNIEVLEKSEPIIPGLLRTLCIIVPAAGAFFIVKRDPQTGMSVLNLIKSAKEFQGKQKSYFYIYNSGRWR